NFICYVDKLIWFVLCNFAFSTSTCKMDWMAAMILCVHNFKSTANIHICLLLLKHNLERRITICLCIYVVSQADAVCGREKGSEIQTSESIHSVFSSLSPICCPPP
ncbi:hypothetical protein L9F63_013434, partial [Diploptera punctata]